MCVQDKPKKNVDFDGFPASLADSFDSLPVPLQNHRIPSSAAVHARIPSSSFVRLPIVRDNVPLLLSKGQFLSGSNRSPAGRPTQSKGQNMSPGAGQSTQPFKSVHDDMSLSRQKSWPSLAYKIGWQKLLHKDPQ